MNRLLNGCVATINSLGGLFWDYASDMFVQSAVLIVLLLLVDFLLRKHVRATFRYWIWMLVFVKLILPPTLSLPTGIGYWFGDHLAADPTVAETPSATPLPKSTMVAVSEVPMLRAEISPTARPEVSIEPAAPAQPAVSRVTPLTWQGVVFLFWLAGVSAFCALLLRRMSFVRRLIAGSGRAEGELPSMLNQCCSELGINRSVELRLSDGTPSPAACGLSKPTILMPVDLPDKLSPDKLRAVLIHELAHIKRDDLWINYAQTLLQIVYFYNPLLWLANAVVRRVREQAVDEMVLVTLGPAAKDYSNTLIDVAEMAFFSLA